MGKRRSLPAHFKSIDEASDFWGTHDSASFSSQMNPVKVKVALKGEEFWLPVGEFLYRKLRLAASRRKTDPVKLVQRWIVEHLAGEG